MNKEEQFYFLNIKTETSVQLTHIRRKKLFVSTNPTDAIFVPTLNSFFVCSSTILEQKYGFRYEKGMFHPLTYLFLVDIYMLS